MLVSVGDFTTDRLNCVRSAISLPGITIVAKHRVLVITFPALGSPILRVFEVGEEIKDAVLLGNDRLFILSESGGLSEWQHDGWPWSQHWKRVRVVGEGVDAFCGNAEWLFLSLIDGRLVKMQISGLKIIKEWTLQTFILMCLTGDTLYAVDGKGALTKITGDAVSNILNDGVMGVGHFEVVGNTLVMSKHNRIYRVTDNFVVDFIQCTDTLSPITAIIDAFATAFDGTEYSLNWSSMVANRLRSDVKVESADVDAAEGAEEAEEQDESSPISSILGSCQSRFLSALVRKREGALQVEYHLHGDILADVASFTELRWAESGEPATLDAPEIWTCVNCQRGGRNYIQQSKQSCCICQGKIFTRIK